MQRKKFDAATKAKVALEAAKGARTANEIAGQYECHPTQVSQWKKELLEAIPTLLVGRCAGYPTHPPLKPVVPN